MLDIFGGLVSFVSRVQVYFPIITPFLESNVGAGCGLEKHGLSDFNLVTFLIGEFDHISSPNVENEGNNDGLSEAEGHDVVVGLEEQVHQILSEVSYL